MNEKSWLILRIVACLYVIYLGVKLILGVLSDRPENMVLMMAAGIFFIVAGAAIVIFSVKDVMKLNKRLAEEAEQTEDSESEITEEGDESEGNRLDTESAEDEADSDTDIHREVSLDIAEEAEKEDKIEK